MTFSSQLIIKQETVMMGSATDWNIPAPKYLLDLDQHKNTLGSTVLK